MAVARIDGLFVKLIEDQNSFACLLVAWFVGRPFDLCNCFWNVFEFVYYMGSHESSVFPLHLQNGSLPPFEIPVFENELMLLPSRSMPLTRTCTYKHFQDQCPASLVWSKCRFLRALLRPKLALGDKTSKILSVINELASWVEPRITPIMKSKDLGGGAPNTVETSLRSPCHFSGILKRRSSTIYFAGLTRLARCIRRSHLLLTLM